MRFAADENVDGRILNELSKMVWKRWKNSPLNWRMYPRQLPNGAFIPLNEIEKTPAR